MNLEKLNSWLTLSANIGVFAGIIFVAYEIRQNTTQLRSETSNSITEAINVINANEYANPELADLLHRGDQSFNSLNDVEKRRYSSYQYSRLNLAEYVLILESEGLSGLQFPYADVIAGDISRSPGLTEWFLSIEEGYQSGSGELLDLIRSSINN